MHECKEIIRMAIGAILLGGVIKEDWLKKQGKEMALRRASVSAGQRSKKVVEMLCAHSIKKWLIKKWSAIFPIPNEWIFSLKLYF